MALNQLQDLDNVNIGDAVVGTVCGGNITYLAHDGAAPMSIMNANGLAKEAESMEKESMVKPSHLRLVANECFFQLEAAAAPAPKQDVAPTQAPSLSA